MLDETERTSPTTSAEPDRQRRGQRRPRYIRASLPASGTRAKGNVAGGGHAAKETPRADRSRDRASLAALVADPDRVVDVPVNQITVLLASLASEQARLAGIQGVLMTRMIESQSAAVTDDSVDRLLTAEEVAKALGVTKRWVQRRARRLPFARLRRP